MKKYLLTIILALCVCSLPLMGGRLRVGDWIECEGIRGKGDRHQLPMRAETIEGTELRACRKCVPRTVMVVKSWNQNTVSMW